MNEVAFFHDSIWEKGENQGNEYVASLTCVLFCSPQQYSPCQNLISTHYWFFLAAHVDFFIYKCISNLNCLTPLLDAITVKSWYYPALQKHFLSQFFSQLLRG